MTPLDLFSRKGFSGLDPSPIYAPTFEEKRLVLRAHFAAYPVMPPAPEGGGKRYTCPGCLRFVPWSFGASDKHWQFCDDCYCLLEDHTTEEGP